MKRAVLELVGGRAGAASLRFVRNIALARMLSFEDYGIASTFIVTMAFVDLISSLGVEKFVVQDRDGDKAKVINTLHLINLLRGFLMAGLLFVLAGEIATLFGSPQIAWAYQLFAVVPLIRSATHLEMFRRQREMSFSTQGISEVSAAAVSLILVFPLVWIFGDFRALLFALAAEQLVRTLVSHGLSPSLFKISWDRRVATRVIRFGIPILASGLVLFVTMQGDRVLVANQFSAAELGFFSAAVTLGMTPPLLIASMADSFLLPYAAKTRGDPPAFEVRKLVIQKVSLALGSSMALAYLLFGAQAFVLLFGARYEPAALICVVIGVIFSIRTARAGPTAISLAYGNTANLLIANLCKLGSFAVAVLAVIAYDGQLIAIVLIGVLGECLAYLLACLLLKTSFGFSRLDALLIPYMLGLAVVCFGIASKFYGDLTIYVAICATGALLFVCRSAFREIRDMDIRT